MLRSLGLISVREHNRFVERICDIHKDVRKAQCDKIAELGKTEERRRVELYGLRREYNELVDKHNDQSHEALKLRKEVDRLKAGQVELFAGADNYAREVAELTRERDDAREKHEKASSYSTVYRATIDRLEKERDEAWAKVRNAIRSLRSD